MSPPASKRSKRALETTSPFATVSTSSNVSFSLRTLLLLMIITAFLATMVTLATISPVIRISAAALFGKTISTQSVAGGRPELMYAVFCYTAPLLLTAIVCSLVAIYRSLFTRHSFVDHSNESDNPFED